MRSDKILVGIHRIVCNYAMTTAFKCRRPQQCRFELGCEDATTAEFFSVCVLVIIPLHCKPCGMYEYVHERCVF